MKWPLFILLCLLSGTAYSQQNVEKETPIYKDPASLPYKNVSPSMRNGKMGLANTRTLETLIPFEYDNIEKIGDAFPYFIAQQNGNYGVLDGQGKTVIAFDYQQLLFHNISSNDPYEDVLSDKDFIFQVKKNGLSGFIDIHHKTILPLVYEHIYFDKSSSFPASKAGKWGMINLKGEIKIPFQYEEMGSIGNVYKVASKGLKGFISKEGKVLLPIQYTSIERFMNNALKNTPYYIITNNSKKGVWDSKTQTYTAALYDKITDACEGNFIVVNNNKYGIINTKNELIIPIQYDHLKFFSLKDPKQPLLAMAKGKYGLIDLSKKQVVAFQYDDIQSISGGFYKACTNGKCKVIDAQGRIITKEVYDNIGIYIDGEASVFKGDQMSIINAYGDQGKFSSSDARGYTDLKTLLEAFATAMNSKNDSIIRAFCNNVTPDKHTVSFLERSGFKDPSLLYDLRKKAYALEDVPTMWFDRLKRFTGKLENLQYVDNGITYLQSEQFCVESVVGSTTFKAGDKEVKIKLGGLMRVDGFWKAFNLPSMAD
ncbi:hypothetical protein GFS24_17330 [Chitinophaga sp. SYP-B3965]|uniref:WG repeat-containing protein n=1 Tax=Chitinophaga sp. SYP-B3965 TaxID=2663120 RepID=UPI001299D18D|nr:WG repeat-containing protein [Chitinophaga sp. SYP-B3965]MRG46887.1 hypothetical protein [Chitinophaga sp. SYP-B3965]